MATGIRPRSQDPADVVALGDINVDLIARFSEFPVHRQDALAGAAELHCGGSAANTAMALSRLGLRVRLVGRVGRDALGAVALRSLRQAGVLLDGIQRDPAVMTGLIYIIVTPGGERTMLSYRGANVRTDPAAIRTQPICSARHLHLSGYALLAEPQRSAAWRAWETARHCGLSLSLDPGLAPAQQQVLDGLLPAASLLLPTLAEAQSLTGETVAEACAQALLERGAQTVALKLGAEGCLVAGGDGPIRVPAFPVEARDSTGAGDSFDAGLIAGFLGGLDWHSAAVLANALGALAAARVGGEASASDSQVVRRLLESHLGQPAYAEHWQAIEQAMEYVRVKA